MSYAKNAPPVFPWGAPMGRPDINATAEPKGALTIQEVYISSGGYDNHGTYWGRGQRLFFVSGVTADEDDIEVTFRADACWCAIDEARRRFPGAEVVVGEPVEIGYDDDYADAEDSEDGEE
jgi:hypothetical protein